jgi:hypothetical protein
LNSCYSGIGKRLREEILRLTVVVGYSDFFACLLLLTANTQIVARLESNSPKPISLSVCAMSNQQMWYPWPIQSSHAKLDVALAIVMDYLEVKGAVDNYHAVQRAAATIIVNEFRNGVTHPVRLANSAIVEVESKLRITYFAS